MPASTLEPISATLKQAFQGIQAKAAAAGGGGGGASGRHPHNPQSANGCSSSASLSLESGLQASAKKSLLSVVQFDSPIRHLGSSALNGLNGAVGFKTNLIFLNPSKKGGTADSSSSGAASPKGTGKAPHGSGDGPTHGGDEPPRPKIVYFPLRAVEVGYHRQRSSGAGMFNMGNTCYLNSTLQALFHTPALFNYLMSDFHKRECGKNGSGGFLQTCMICILTSTLKDTLSVNVMRPNRVYEKLKNICKHLVHGRQEDAHEFLRYLIESLQKSFLVSRHAPKNLDNASKETTPFNQIFGGYMRQDVTCLKCKYVSVTFQHFMDLLLDIRQTSNIDDALSIYFRAERIGSGDGVNTYKCEKCNMKVPAKKKCFIERPPVVLCVQLKRFSLLGGKISRSVQLSRRIEMNSFVKKKDISVNPLPPLQYKLVAMITHVGPSPNCGHYTAIGEASNGQFFQFDDASVRPISINQALNTASYVVFYEMTKQSKEAWVEQMSPALVTKEPIYKHPSSSKPFTATSSSTASSLPSQSNGTCLPTSNSSPVIPKAKLATGLNGTVNKLGVVAKSTPSSLSQSAIGPKKPAQLVPYESEDSSDSSDDETKPGKQNGRNPPISIACLPSSTTATSSTTTSAVPKSMPFVPRSVTVNALKRSQEPRSDSPAMGNGSSNGNSVSKLADHVPQKDVKPSGSGLWQVLDTEHHNPSISSDNSNGSTSGAWHVTPSTAAPTTTIAASSVVTASETTPSPIVNGTKPAGQDPSELSDHNNKFPQPQSHPTLPQQTSVTASSTASSSLSSTPEHSRASKRSSSIEEYEAELDRGRTKKVKKRHLQRYRSYDGETEQSSRPSFNSSNFNPFQAHQNKTYNGRGYQHHHARNDDNDQLQHPNQRSQSSNGFNNSGSSTWSGSRRWDRSGSNHKDYSRVGGKRHQNFRRTHSSSSLNGSEQLRNFPRNGHENRDDRRRFNGGGANYHSRGNRDYDCH